MANKGGKSGARPDVASLSGILIAFGGIVGGLLLEGGKISDISQVTAGIIVIGGTLGAVMLTTPLSVLIGAVKQRSAVFFEKSHNPTRSEERRVGKEKIAAL